MSWVCLILSSSCFVLYIDFDIGFVLRFFSRPCGFRGTASKVSYTIWTKRKAVDWNSTTSSKNWGKNICTKTQSVQLVVNVNLRLSQIVILSHYWSYYNQRFATPISPSYFNSYYPRSYYENYTSWHLPQIFKNNEILNLYNIIDTHNDCKPWAAINWAQLDFLLL